MFSAYYGNFREQYPHPEFWRFFGVISRQDEVFFIEFFGIFQRIQKVFGDTITVTRYGTIEGINPTLNRDFNKNFCKRSEDSLRRTISYHLYIFRSPKNPLRRPENGLR